MTAVDPSKLRKLRLVTRSRGEMASALPLCWRALRGAGFRRRDLIVAFARAWRRGDLAVDPSWEPPDEPRVLFGKRPGRS